LASRFRRLWGAFGFEQAGFARLVSLERIGRSLLFRCLLASASNEDRILNPLSAICAGRNSDMETLDLLAAGGEAHFSNSK
jgi:hypothetical protein